MSDMLCKVNQCCKSIESLMKVICQKENWKYEPGKNNIDIPDYLKKYVNHNLILLRDGHT